MPTNREKKEKEKFKNKNKSDTKNLCNVLTLNVQLLFNLHFEWREKREVRERKRGIEREEKRD